MITPIIKGKVIKGKFIPNDIIAFKLSFCKHEGKEVEVTVKRKTSKRSNSQNKYYWGVVIELISDYTGYTPNETHDYLRLKCLIKENEGGFKTLKSTTELSTVEMEKYLEDCRRDASLHGIYIPLPNEVDL